MYKNNNWCCEKQIKPLYNNITEKDYFEPIKRFSKENKYIKVPTKINDDVIHYYIKSMKNISIIIVYPAALKHPKYVEILIEKLKDKGDIHYIKDISLNYYMAYNLIYQLYANEKRMKLNGQILYKINRLGFTNIDNINPIKIIVYSLNEKSIRDNINISGSSANFKMELRDIFVKEDIKTTKYSPEDDNYPRGYDYLHVSDNSNQSYEYAGIFFHENSIHFLEKQKSWRLLEMSKARENFNKLKNFMYDYSMLELEKLLLNSSVVLFTHGIREANDIDGMLLENTVISGDDIKKINNGEILDISYRPLFNDEWLRELNDRAKLMGASDYEELVLNPKYYYYFMGIKILRLKYDIKIRFLRQRPAQFTDLLIIRQMFMLNYKLSIPETTKTYNEETKITDTVNVDKSKYISTVQYYLKIRYEINLSIEQVKEWIEMTYVSNDKYFLEGGSESDSSNSIESSLKKYIIQNKNIAYDDIIYPTMDELIKMKYAPNIIIYSSDKPYLYPGESFIDTNCRNESTIIREKNNPKRKLRIATINLHNFISRCNQGIAPLFGTALNPFEKPRDINRFIKFFNSLDADVICMQELVPLSKDTIKEDITDIEYIRNNFNFKYLNKLMEDIGYKYSIIGGTQNGNFLKLEKNDYYFLANGIYSKIKFEDSNVYNYSFLNRNIINGIIIWNNRKINIYNINWEYFNSISLKTTENPLILQSNMLFDLIKDNLNNTVLCGDFNINLFKNDIKNPRYFKWEERTQKIRENFINTNRTNIPTNFLQLDQTDFIILSKKANIKPIFSLVVKTNISNHYCVLTEFV